MSLVFQLKCLLPSIRPALHTPRPPYALPLQVDAQGELLQVVVSQVKALQDSLATATAKAKTMPGYLEQLWNGPGSVRKSWRTKDMAPIADFLQRLVQWFDEEK